MLTESNIDIWINYIPFLHSSNTIKQEHPKRALSGIRFMPDLFFNSNYSYPSKHDFIWISIVMRQTGLFSTQLLTFQLYILQLFACILGREVKFLKEHQLGDLDSLYGTRRLPVVYFMYVHAMPQVVDQPGLLLVIQIKHLQQTKFS